MARKNVSKMRNKLFTRIYSKYTILLGFHTYLAAFVVSRSDQNIKEYL